MNRREFVGAVAAGLFAGTLPAEAQQTGTSRIGILSSANPRSATIFRALEQRLRDLGYVDIEFRNADGKFDRMPRLVQELVRLNVGVIVCASEPAMEAATRATTTIPIVMLAVNYDPIKLGYIASLARPGGNVTGVFFQHREVTAKRFGLFRELLPAVGRVAIFSDAQTVDQLREVETANRLAGLKLQPMELRNPPYDFESVSRAAARSGVEAIFVLESPSIFRGRAQIAELALRNRLPTSFAFREYVEVGGLVSYGVNFLDMWRRAAEFTDKVLRGARPGDLPVEQPTKFELVVNMKTAKALALSVPPSLLLQADQVLD